MSNGPKKNTLTMGATDTAPPPYAYGRRFYLGSQEARVLFAQAKSWPDQSRYVEVTVGLASPDAGGGVKVDYKANVPSDAFNSLLALFAPHALAAGFAGDLDLDAWKGKAVRAVVGEEKDRKRSESEGRDVKRAKVLSLAQSATTPGAPS